MNENKTFILATITRLSVWIPITLIGIISILRSCFGPQIDPMDDSVNTNREVVAHVEVVDSTLNGFRVVYTTVNSVSKERLNEIQNRPHIQDGFKKLKRDAPLYFGSMLQTDIYNFARFAVKYDSDKDIRIHNIFVTGKEKMDLYAGYNPKILGYATWIDPNTLQGVQFLSQKDIYNLINSPDRVYRYWKCISIYSTSYEDERFSHFSEAQRVY